MADLDASGHIVFVGMMGSGKTTVGRRVANRLEMRFVDADAALVDATGREITEWFAQAGEQGFRAAEERVVADLLAESAPTVVATGGGVVLSDTTRAALCESRHTVVWLRAGPAFLASRLSGKHEQHKRPLLADDPRAAMERLDAERRDLYAEVADIVIDIEPVMRAGDHPRRRLAALVVDALSVAGARTYA